MSSKRSFGMFSDEENIEDKFDNYEPISSFGEDDLTDNIDEEVVVTPKEKYASDKDKNYSTNTTNPTGTTSTGTPNNSGNTKKQLGHDILKQKIYSFAEKTAKKFIPSNMSAQQKQFYGMIGTAAFASLLEKYFNKK